MEDNKYTLKTYFNKTKSSDGSVVKYRAEPTVRTEFKCSSCDDVAYCSETELEIHEMTIHRRKRNMSEENNPKVCPACLLRFPTDLLTLKHYKEYHLFSSPEKEYINRHTYICHHCEALFHNRELFVVHLDIKHGFTSERMCPLCYKYYMHIRPHLCYDHGLTRITTCPSCFGSFKSRREMLDHVDEKHNFGGDRNRDVFDVGNRKYNSKFSGVVDRYFVTQNPYFRRKTQTVMNGVFLRSKVSVCVLCRAICTDARKKFQHLVTNHDFGTDSFEGLVLKQMELFKGHKKIADRNIFVKTTKERKKSMSLARTHGIRGDLVKTRLRKVTADELLNLKRALQEPIEENSKEDTTEALSGDESMHEERLDGTLDEAYDQEHLDETADADYIEPVILQDIRMLDDSKTDSEAEDSVDSDEFKLCINEELVQKPIIRTYSRKCK